MRDGIDLPTPAEWRAAMGYFPTGVTVVTTWQDGKPMGATINAFCSVSLEPPMLLICLSRDSILRGPIERCGVFGVNLLAEHGHHLALRFAAKPETERFRGLDLLSADGGAPQLKDAPVFVDCVLETFHTAGDHFIVIGNGVRTYCAATASPLLYHRGGFPKFGTGS